MKISSKTGLVLILIFLSGGAYLVGMFYYSASDLGNFSQTGQLEPAVLGQNVERWRLPKDEALVAFSAGQGDFKEDKLFITAALAGQKRHLRITRGPESTLIYQQEISPEFESALWRKDSNSFLVSSSKSALHIELTPGQQTYHLAGD